MLYKTPKYNEYFGENFKFFDVLDFIAKLTVHIPPKNKQYIRRYGLYSSRTRGLWEQKEFCIRLAPNGWQEKYLNNPDSEEVVSKDKYECSTCDREQKSAWAKLISKVYGVDPLIRPLCGSEMIILAVIVDPEEVKKILKHLVKIGRPPPNFDPSSLN
ncbi:hypothetical protein ES705_38694 [subsurface metagenome]